MRLLNTKDMKELRLQEFSQDDIPKYAILSHRWEKEEVTLQDVRNQTFARMTGFSKIQGCCKRAAKDGYDWVWIDTCCIDKSSSAELSEAINSMYRWYEDSSVCYAYLSDVQGIVDLKSSKWFSRGWTLQELIAPRRVILFDRQWRKMGTKYDNAEEISFITGIPEYILYGTSPLFCNVAQRMSWASRRDTTREEDMSYCLMGLFNVHMSPIYGEGSEKAFLRLQEEILKRNSDQTLFLWTASHEPYNHGLLATSPKAFCIHYEYFSWLDILNMPQDGFDPYAVFIPTSTTPGSRIFDRRSKSYIDESPVTIEPSFLGSNGLQISLLSYDEYHGLDVIRRSTKRVMVSLDVRVLYSEIRRDIYLRLTEDNTTEFSYSTKLDRLGALRRLEGSTPVVDIMPFRMERKRLSISQVHGRAPGSPAKFVFIRKWLEKAGKEALMFEGGGG